ncbi:MAG: phenylalanine--tRNA ligase subunit beta [Holosporaceae bacterium]|nr:MAG: phenylalanine--tRNA ligase subunit beta [Holosporaceae bacterium]
MKFTLSWLKEHLDTTRPLNDILETLTNIGLEVESVTNPADQFQGFQIAEILEAAPHPNADRLQVCKVNSGEKTLQIVCGAPNARAGIKVVLGLPGAYVPALDVTLKETKIRGVESFGMLCSAKELGLGEEHNGILEVAAAATVGKSYVAEYGIDDPVIDISVTPNRPDCLGVRGVARDLAAAGLGTLKPLSIPSVAGTFKSPLALKRDAAVADGCPHYMGRFLKGVQNKPSPDWLKKKLNAIGMRSISALVDITNYVSIDLCRPLHVFDADKLDGPVTVRLSKKGESFVALDENTYALNEGHVVIADNHHVAALGGVMGGMDSGCTLETQNVLLESAYFDPIHVAQAGRETQMHTDARHRFERGVDPLSTQMGIERATDLILKICGGAPSDTIELGEPLYAAPNIPFKGENTLKRTGMDIPDAEQENILDSLGFSLKKGFVTPPSWRPDVSETADVIEEVARIYGYAHLPEPVLPAAPHIKWRPEKSAEILARHALADRRFMEVVTWSMVSEEDFSLFGGKGTSTKSRIPLRLS